MKSKNLFLCSILTALLFLNSTSIIFAKETNTKTQYKDFIVKFNTNFVNWEQLTESFGVTSFRPIFGSANNKSFYVIKIPSDNLESFKNNKIVESVVPNTTIVSESSVNDEFFTELYSDIDKQWYLPKISANLAWDIRSDASRVVVAIIDTGINPKHQDLTDDRVIAGQNIYCYTIGTDSCEKHIQSDIAVGEISDDNGHGTTIASLIGAIGDNMLGIAGVARNIKLMPVKVLNENGLGTTADVAEGIVWASQHGADIINLSLGGASLADSEIVSTAIDLAVKQGALIVSAAGNDRSSSGVDLDKFPSSPVCNDGGNNYVLGVSATDYQDIRAGFSNYGTSCIDISAPGVRILGAFYDVTKPDENNAYAYRSGTSFSTAITSGAAALVKAHFPSLTPAEIIARLRDNADPIDQLNLTNCNGLSCAGKLGSGRLNILRALGGVNPEITPTTTPPVIPDDPVDDPPATTDNSFNGTLVKSDIELTAYYIENGIKRPLNYFNFILNNFSFDKIQTLTKSKIDSFPTGSLYPAPDGKIVKAKNLDTVYVTSNGTIRPLSYFSFISHKYSFSNLKVFSVQDLDQVDKGSFMPPPNGFILKSPSDSTVYLVENLLLHPLTLEAFNKRKLLWADLKIRPFDELNLYPKGVLLLE